MLTSKVGYTLLLLSLIQGEELVKAKESEGNNVAVNLLDPDSIVFGNDKLKDIINATNIYLTSATKQNPYGKKYETVLTSFATNECKITEKQQLALDNFVAKTKLSFVDDYEIKRCCALACEAYDEKKEVFECRELFGPKGYLCDEVDHQLFKVKLKNSKRNLIKTYTPETKDFNHEAILSRSGRRRLTTCLGIVSKLRVICIDECHAPAKGIGCKKGSDGKCLSGCTKTDEGDYNCDLDEFERVRLENLNKIKDISKCDKYKR